MSSIFNTPFEVSLRILLTLESAPRQWWTADRIAAFDFITAYSGDFGIANANLHGENNYKYSEFALRRETVKEALKSLVAKNLVDVQASTDGFVYALSKAGGDFSSTIESSYANNYRELAVAVKIHYGEKTDRSLLAAINQNAISSIRRSNVDG